MRKKLVFALIVALCICMVACGGEPEGTTAPTAPSTTAPTPTEPFEITFDPAREDLPDRATAEQIKERECISARFSPLWDFRKENTEMKDLWSGFWIMENR